MGVLSCVVYGYASRQVFNHTPLRSLPMTVHAFRQVFNHTPLRSLPMTVHVSVRSRYVRDHSHYPSIVRRCARLIPTWYGTVLLCCTILYTALTPRTFLNDHSHYPSIVRRCARLTPTWSGTVLLCCTILYTALTPRTFLNRAVTALLR